MSGVLKKFRIITIQVKICLRHMSHNLDSAQKLKKVFSKAKQNVVLRKSSEKCLGAK